MEKVLELSEMLTRQEARIARRKIIRRRLRKLRRARALGEVAVARLHRRRKQLLRQCGAESEEHLQRLVAEAARVENLRREHEHLQHDLAATIAENAEVSGTVCTEPEKGSDGVGADKRFLTPPRATLAACGNIWKVRPLRTSMPAATTFGPGWRVWKKRSICGSKSAAGWPRK